MKENFSKEEIKTALESYSAYPQNCGVHPVMWANLETKKVWESPLVGENWCVFEEENVISVNVQQIYWQYGDLTVESIFSYLNKELSKL